MTDTIERIFENISFSELDIQTDKSKPSQLLGIVKLPSISGATYLVKLHENRTYGPHSHKEAEEEIIIFHGRGRFFCHGNWFDYNKDSRFFVPKRNPHAFEVDATTYLLSVQTADVVNNGNLDIGR